MPWLKEHTASGLPIEEIIHPPFINGSEGVFFILLRHFRNGELTEFEFHQLLLTQPIRREVGFVDRISVLSKPPGYPTTILEIYQKRFGPLQVDYTSKHYRLAAQFYIDKSGSLKAKIGKQTYDDSRDWENGALFDNKTIDWRVYFVEGLKYAMPIEPEWKL